MSKSISIQGSSSALIVAHPCVLVGGEFSASGSAATVDLYDVPVDKSVHADYLISHCEIPLDRTEYPDFKDLQVSGRLYATTVNDEQAFLYIK